MNTRAPCLTALLLAAAALVLVTPEASNAGASMKFDSPVALPGGDAITEPSIAIDHQGRLYVSGPSGLVAGSSGVSGSPLGVAGGNSPAWRSDNGGRSWHRLAPTSLADQRTRLGGGDTDVITDKRGYVYATDLWLGDDSIAVSRDHGATWTGSPISHRPGDDRNWLAYSAHDDALYQVYDGIDGLWISRADLSESDTIAPLVWRNNTPVYTWGDGFHPPGRLAVDARGCLYVAFVGKGEMQVGSSCDKGQMWHFTVIAKTTNPYYLTDIAVDGRGEVAVAWGDSDVVNFSQSSDHGASFSTRRLPASRPATFPVVDALANGHWSVAWLENSTGDAWDARFALITTLGGRVTWRIVTAATSVVTGGATAVSSRIVGDFMSAAVAPNGDYYLTVTRKQGTVASTVVLRLPRSKQRL